MNKNGIEYMHGSYVYYQRLLTDAINNPELANFAKTVNDNYLYTQTEINNFDKYAYYFYELSDGELKKEKQLLVEKFGGVDILKDLNIEGNYNEGGVNYSTNLIKAINYILGSRDIFLRNLKLIQTTQGEKSVINSFPWYFNQVWNGDWYKNKSNEKGFNEDKLPKAIRKINQLDKNYIIRQAEIQTKNIKNKESRVIEIKKQIKKNLPEVIQCAVQLMFYAQAETTSLRQSKEMQEAYLGLSKALMRPKNDKQYYANEDFLNSFNKIYNLENYIYEEVDKKYKGKPPEIDIEVGRDIKGGNEMEYFRTYMMQTTLSSLTKNGEKYKVTPSKILNTGSNQGRPDWIATFSFNIQPVSDWADKYIMDPMDYNSRNKSFKNRIEAVKAAKELEHRLRKFDDGFIIYGNAKNYTYNEGFEKRGGFSAGTPIPLRTFDEILKLMHMRDLRLIRAAMQIIPGAIGENDKEIVSKNFSTKIAASLFDDFDEIGIQSSGARAIHLLDLNGILMPLSFYLWLLGNAFNEASQQKLSDLVRTTIHTPNNIAYPEHGEGQPDGKWTSKDWENQRNIALDQITVEYHFLSKFKEIMTNFVKI